MISFNDFLLKEKIEKRGDKWVVLNKSGSTVLGSHDSEKEALSQLAAIEISKSKHGNVR